MQNRLRLVLTFVLAIAADAVLGLPEASAQVSLTGLGTPYTQNFDTLPASGSAAWANNSTIPGWFHARTGTGTTILANDGSSNAGNLYSYGTGTATERALGSVGSGNAAAGSFFYGVRLQNNTGLTITSLDVSYTGEQWRNSAAAANTAAFSYLVGSPTVTGTLAEFQTAGVAVTGLDFTSPITGGAAGALNGNLAANRVTLTVSITGLSIPNGTEVMLRWSDPDQVGADHGLSIDDFTVTPQGSGGGISLSIADVSQAEGDAGTTTFNFVVSLSGPAFAGGVVFDIATLDGTAQDDNPITEDNDYVANSLTGQVIPEGSQTFPFNVTVNGDTGVELDETFFVNVTNVGGAGVNVGDPNAVGTILNDDVTLVFIHDVQGSGASTPIPPSTQVRIEGVVTANFQGTDKLSGFFLQEEDADADANPLTSEGIFVFCNACSTPVAEGQRVQATGLASESSGMTQVTASAAGSVVVTNAGNNLAAVTAAPIDLPVVGVIDDFYEAREGMLVNFVDPLTVSEYFELPRYGQIELYEGGRPQQFTETNAPSVPGNTAYLATLDRRRVVLDDDDNTQNSPLALPANNQFVFHPRANGGLSIGVQGTDFFRGGDLVNNLRGVLHRSFAGQAGTDAWRIRPTAANPAAFTVANPRPATAPALGGAIKAASVNLLNYFTTIDTTANNSGPCGPATDQDCRGADSVVELARQRIRTAIVLCGLNADVFGLVELENTTPSDTINDLLGEINGRCGGSHPYLFVNTGGTLGTDAIRVQQIYRMGVLSPVGSPLVDLDSIHNRPPTAQTYDVVDPLNAAFGQRFTVIANHFKSKGCSGATGGDLDMGDGQGCFASHRTAQATRLLLWISGTVLPAAGDPDVLLLGDFNSYAQETPVTTLMAGGFTDLATAMLGSPAAYSYLFDGQLGHLDYAFASASLTAQVVGIGIWHINADEADLFDYNDEIADVGEATFEAKPNGSALVPPRNLFQTDTAVRAADHDPVLVGFGLPAATATPTATATATATSTSTSTATRTATSISTATRTATSIPTATSTAISTSTATRTATAAATSTPTATRTATATSTQPAATATPTGTAPAATATPTSTAPAATATTTPPATATSTAPAATATSTAPAATATATNTQPAATATPTVPQSPPLCSRSDGCFRFDLMSANFSNPTDARFTWSLTNTCNDPLARVDFRFVPGARVTDLTENGSYNSGLHTYDTDIIVSQHPGIAFVPSDGDPITQNESDLFAFDVDRADLQQDTVLWNSASTAGSAVGRMDIRSALCYQLPPPTANRVLGPDPGPARLALGLGLLAVACLAFGRNLRMRKTKGE